ncbi:MAG: ferric reductase-like transmembrane domain-containing protein [Bacteroidia bacterium]|nr:ferric reductase-like transmembrane domain-containing protein [Bacteroidia bacterium]
MSHTYVPVLWNRQKKIYDLVLWGGIFLFLAIFIACQLIFFPEITAESLIIRATGTLAFVMLHIILAIGPIARLNPVFLPLLYNRRHFGVSMFIVALVHGIFNLIQFHSFGNSDPILSIFTSNEHYNSLTRFPFQSLGFFALLILFLMAATSHDFWLKNLSPRVWKGLHMMVYVAYGLLIFHVLLGVVQTENSFFNIGLLGIGMVSLIGLHLMASLQELKGTEKPDEKLDEDFVFVCEWDDILENRAKTVMIEDQNIAVFKYDQKVSAVNNLCRHQNGPLGEGKILDGCITCPWHGYQYLPENGQSPPPFTEKVETYDVKIIGEKIYVNPKPYPEGTERPPAIYTPSSPSSNGK